MTFRRGQRVRVSAREHAGHHRTPSYLKGKTGRIERVYGTFTNPETRAYSADGLPEQRLYHVGFEQVDMWPDYRGPTRDRVYGDVFEHWLEEVE
jgi:Nitrile hydratase beta subunit, C-terminal